MAGQEGNVVESCTSHFPTLLIDLSLFIIGIFILLIALDFHLFTNVAHHTFRVKIDKLLQKTAIRTVGLVKFFSKFATESAYQIGKGGKRGIEDVADHFDVVDILVSFELVYVVQKELSDLFDPVTDLYVVGF